MVDGRLSRLIIISVQRYGKLLYFLYFVIQLHNNHFCKEISWTFLDVLAAKLYLNLKGWQGSPLYFQGALLCLGEDVGVADDPEEGEEGETARQDCAVELDTPHAGRQGGTAQ